MSDNVLATKMQFGGGEGPPGSFGAQRNACLRIPAPPPEDDASSKNFKYLIRAQSKTSVDDNILRGNQERGEGAAQGPSGP